jgi:nucleotide-binding universal stress UspA family protein
MSYRIVVGVDGSPHSTAALRWSLDEAAAHAEAEVVAVLAWQVPFLSNPAAFERDELQQTYEEFLVKSVSEIVPTPAVPLHTLVAEGDPTEALLEAARHCQLLVLGSRGRSPLKGLMLGSVSQACAAGAACPVVVVKVSAGENG